MKALFFSLLLAAIAMTAAAADLTGKWSGTFTTQGPDGPRDSEAFMIVKQTGTQITGSAGPNEAEQWPIKNAKLTGNTLTGEAANPAGPVYKFTLVLTGDRLKGDVDATNGGQTVKAKLDLGRVK
jgi:hypothetical protein